MLKSILILLLISTINLFSADYDNQPLAAYLKDGKWHFIDHTGKEIFKPKELAGVSGFSEGFYTVKIDYAGDELWAFLDSKGNTVTTVANDLLGNFSCGRAMTVDFEDREGLHRKNGFIDHNGRQVIQTEYIDALDFTEGLAYLMNEGVRGYVDTTGSFKIILDKLIGFKFSEGLAAVSDENIRFGFIDTTGKMVIEKQFDEAGNFSEGLAKVNNDGKFGYIDKSGKLEIGYYFDEASDFSENMAFVGEGDMIQKLINWGLIDRKGEMVTEFIFDEVRPFFEGLAAVRLGQNWGFLKPDGSFEHKIEFSYADSFVNGIAWASQKDKGIFGFINHKGEYVMKLPEAERYIDLRLNRALW